MERLRARRADQVQPKLKHYATALQIADDAIANLPKYDWAQIRKLEAIILRDLDRIDALPSVLWELKQDADTSEWRSAVPGQLADRK